MSEDIQERYDGLKDFIQKLNIPDYTKKEILERVEDVIIWLITDQLYEL